MIDHDSFLGRNFKELAISAHFHLSFLEVNLSKLFFLSSWLYLFSRLDIANLLYVNWKQVQM